MLREQLGCAWECGLLMSREWDNIRTVHWMTSLSIIPIIQLQPHPPHYHLITMSSYDCDVSADFADVFDVGREGMIYSSLTKENKREKTPVPSKPKGKARAPPRKPRGQPQGTWSGASEEGDDLDL